jgi:dCMP deaminase
MNKIILAYVPVLHQGYWQFFQKYVAEVKTLYLFGQELIEGFSHLSKDIRALEQMQVKQAIEGWQIFESVRIADKNTLKYIQAMKSDVVMPDEDECHVLASQYLDGCRVEFDNVFLRWDKTKSLATNEVKYDRAISIDSLEGEIMKCAVEESVKGTNWWRRTGAVLALNGKILLAGYNRQVPSAYTPYFEGDARSLFRRGINIELTTDQHAEVHLISEAARRGIALEGSYLYITTFPCPVCAKNVAYAGIKRCYFNSGYALLDGERILHDKSIEIILVTDK